MPRSILEIGKLYATPGALDALHAAGKNVIPYLLRHASCDWGDLDAEDKHVNDEALLSGARILSAYQITPYVRIWIITEAKNDDGVRQATTVLLPSEYRIARPLTVLLSQSVEQRCQTMAIQGETFMSALDASIANLTSEYEALKNRLVEIDSAYRDRANTVKQVNRLARALSTLTGKPVAGATGTSSPRAPMSEEAKARIKAGLERARAAKAAGNTSDPQAATSEQSKPTQTASQAVKKDSTIDKSSSREAHRPPSPGTQHDRGAVVSRTTREWALGFTHHAAEITEKPRTRHIAAGGGTVPRTEMRNSLNWLGLRSKRNGEIVMSAGHLAVYRALIDFADDAAEEVATATPSIPQLVPVCGYNASKVGEILKDLTEVGFIARKQRTNTSSITTIYREPGHFGGLEAEVVPSATPKTECYPLKLRLKATDKDALIEKLLEAAGSDWDSDLLTQQIEQALAFKDGNLESLEPITFSSEEEVQECAEKWNRILRPEFHCAWLGNAEHEVVVLVIMPAPEVVASQLLTKLLGRDVNFSSVPEPCRDKPYLALLLHQELWPSRIREPLLKGLQGARNPAGYLYSSLPGICDEWDEKHLEALDQIAGGSEDDDLESEDEDSDQEGSYRIQEGPDDSHL